MKYSESKEKKSGYNVKPDALCHKGKDFETAKDAKIPGQMYVPKKVHNQSDFAGEKK